MVSCYPPPPYEHAALVGGLSHAHATPVACMTHAIMSSVCAGGTGESGAVRRSA